MPAYRAGVSESGLLAVIVVYQVDDVALLVRLGHAGLPLARGVLFELMPNSGVFDDLMLQKKKQFLPCCNR